MIIVGVVSAFVAVLTYVLGLAGTIIGSVITSVLYNMLTEALEKPVDGVSIKDNFEWEVVYVFPLVVIALIQILFILAIFSEEGILPYTFLNFYLSLQDVAANNLYRILGIALLVISVYPLVLKPEYVKRAHGIIIAIVGIIFLARGFVDFQSSFTESYRVIFANFDLPIAIIALVLLLIVIVRILYLAIKETSSNNAGNNSQEDENQNIPRPRYKLHVNRENSSLKKKYMSHNHDKFKPKNQVVFKSKTDFASKKNSQADVDGDNSQSGVNGGKSQSNVNGDSSQSGINESSDKIHFESNDLLDDYKK